MPNWHAWQTELERRCPAGAPSGGAGQTGATHRQMENETEWSTNGAIVMIQYSD